MSVIPSDLVIYGAANMPESDVGVVGNAIDTTKRVDFFDVSPNGTIDIISSSASDTGVKVTYQVRDATGATATVTATFNGTVAVAGGQTSERLLSAAITGGSIGAVSNPGGTAPVGDCIAFAHTKVIANHLAAAAGATNPSGATPTLVALQSGDGASVGIGEIIRFTNGSGINTVRKIIAVSGYGTDVVAVSGSYGTGTGLPQVNSAYDVLQGMLFERNPNSVLAITRLFATAAADVPGGATKVFYEKVFAVNNNTATALTPQSGSTGVALQITSETPAFSGTGVTLDLGADTVFNGTANIATRQVAPAGIAFTSQPRDVYAPSPGNLAPGAAPNAAGALALWLRLTVGPGSSPYKGAATLQTLGNTT